MKTADFTPLEAKIIELKDLCDDVVGLKLKPLKKFPVFLPGQFVLISVLGFGSVPIAITNSPEEKGYLEVAVRSVGMVTKKIHALSVGDKVGILGPFGNGFPMPKIKGRDVVLIAGGLGLAPLRSLIRYAERKKHLFKSLTILNGARNEEQLLYHDEYPEWEKFANLNLTVDKCGPNWSGCIGNVTKLFDKVNIERGSVMIVCGPPVMFQSIIDRYAGKKIADKDLYFLLERKMSCGVGKCQHCTCGKYYVCLDGPVFSYYQLKYNKEAFK